MAPNSELNLDPKSAFWASFKQHWKEGAGRPARADPRHKGWTDREFLDAMGRCGHQISDDVLRLWWAGRSFPNPHSKEGIFKVYFPGSDGGKGDTDADKGFRGMEGLWRQVHDRPRSRGDQPPPNEPSGPLAEWTISQGRGTEGIVELRLHPPPPGNVADTFYVDATLRLDTGEYDCEERTVSIGLRDAFLSIVSPGYQTAKGSLIGERAEHEHFKPAPGGAKISGPVDGHGCLSGDPLGEEHLAIIEPAGEGEETVTVAVHAGRRSFVVSTADTQDERTGSNVAPANKDAVLNALIYKGREKDAQGRVILALARMQHKPRA
jgi:hypothetical protein